MDLHHIISIFSDIRSNDSGQYQTVTELFLFPVSILLLFQLNLRQPFSTKRFRRVKKKMEIIWSLFSWINGFCRSLEVLAPLLQEILSSYYFLFWRMRVNLVYAIVKLLWHSTGWTLMFSFNMFMFGVYGWVIKLKLKGGSYQMKPVHEVNMVYVWHF